jgi:hypothetical protein
VEQWFDSFLGNSPLRWLEAGAVAVAVLFVLLILRRVARKQYARLAATPQQEFLELPLHVASRTASCSWCLHRCSSACRRSSCRPKVARVVLTVFTVASFWQIGLWATTALVEALAAGSARRSRWIALPPARSRSSASWRA